MHRVEQHVEFRDGRLAPRGLELFFKLLLTLRKPFESRNHVIFTHMESRRHLRQHLASALVVVQATLAGQGLDTAYSRGHRLFDRDFEYANIAGAAHVGAAAKLLGKEAARGGGICSMSASSAGSTGA